jgi:hypothetical protein
MVPSWASYDTWNIGIATLDHPLRNIRELQPLRHVRWLPPRPPLYFLADPFPYRQSGRDWLLVEEYGHPKGVRGRISRIDPDSAASAETPHPVIARGRHISYPYTFTDGGDIYCAPEMSQEDGCVLYRLADDGQWLQQHHVLKGTRLVDPTIFRFANRWWLFGAEPPPLHTRTLHAYFADAIEGPWTPHPLNPLKRDVASSRPAGRPFTIGDRLYRPAQDCHETYGGAVHVMEILTLTPEDFREAVALRLEPDPAWPYPDGLHHLVVDGTRVYFDAKRRRTDFLLPLKTRRRR